MFIVTNLLVSITITLLIQEFVSFLPVEFPIPKYIYFSCSVNSNKSKKVVNTISCVTYSRKEHIEIGISCFFITGMSFS